MNRSPAHPMPFHERLAVAFVLALTIGMASQLDGPDDTEAAQAVAEEAAYAAAQADGGIATCAALGAIPKWLPDGSLRCRPVAQAPAVTVLAQGDAP